MTFIHALILGIVEGITEFLPISSTGHLVLTSHILGLPESDFLKTFEIAIQLGAILAALILYWRALLLDRRMLAKTVVAFLPTAALGFLAYPLVKVMLGRPTIVVWSLLGGGILLIVLERVTRNTTVTRREVQEISFWQAFLIGSVQAISMVPGVSRSAATIIAGLMMGIGRKAIVEFSFLLAVPTMAAATGYDLLKSYRQFTDAQFDLLAVGFGVSFLMALVAIKALLGYVEHHTFVAFGVYRIVLAIAFTAWAL
ncbi:MAG: undecaprenyl-diphosphate phosphatase [Vicinamibacterales bacterium]